MANPVVGSYNAVVKLKITNGMYAAVGVIGILVGGAYLFRRQYFFGLTYAIVGAIWLLISRRNPREETAVQPSVISSLEPSHPAGSSAPPPAYNVSKSAQS